MKTIVYTPENVHLLIRIKAKKKDIDEVLLAAYQTILPTHKEEGCLEYRVFHVENEVVIFGTWKSKMALDMHLLLQFHLRLVEEILPSLSKKTSIKIYKEIEPPITALSLG